jgi:hypothetical protein
MLHHMPFRNKKKRNGAYSMLISVNLSSEEVTIILPKIKKNVCCDFYGEDEHQSQKIL